MTALISTWAPVDQHTWRREERQQLLELLHAEVATCRLCVEAGYIPSAAGVAGFRGYVGQQLMLVGQAPGHLSVARGLPFAGQGGRVLETWLQRAGYPAGALHTHIYLSALTKCYPGKSVRGGGDRKPSPAELALCRPFLLRELELIRPRAILLVGGMAIQAFLGSGRLDGVVGTSYERNGVMLLPLPHPSGVSRWLNRPEHQEMLQAALEILAGWRRNWERGDSVTP
jgi:uracil-DNA glycosylase family 4